jgi:prepilin-type N-terminal cleavage/methylation domain-containing protein
MSSQGRRGEQVRERSRKRQGFSLMELMTVVAIVGILSAVAIPTFSNYIYKSRTSEATEFLGVIRLREESYRAEFGVYCATVTSSPNDVTALNTHSNLIPNPETTRREAKPFPGSAAWTQLGARPTGPVRFGYAVVAGTPADAVATGLGWTTANTDFWFVARAVGDLNGDDTFCTFEIYSPTKNIFIADKDNKPLAKGWE